LDGAAVQSHSVRGLLRFLSPPRGKPKKTPLENAWKKATAEERKAFFAAVDFNEARAAFPADYFKKLGQHFTDQLLLVEKAGKPTIDPCNPPSPIVTARKAIRLAMAPEILEGQALAALHAARKIITANGILVDDVLYVPNAPNKGIPTRNGRARRRAA
jgi:hypothetical protein